MEPLQIKRHTDQTPLAGRCRRAAQRELTESQHLFDDPEHWLNRILACAVDRFPDCPLKFVGHLDLGIRVIGGRWGRSSTTLPPAWGMRGPPAPAVRGKAPASATPHIAPAN